MTFAVKCHDDVWIGQAGAVVASWWVLETGRPSCDLIGVTLLGDMESVESPSPRVRKVTVLPVAIW